MNNQEILIIILIIILVIMKFLKLYENFEINNFPCEKNPFNSNCTCPSDAPQRVILGEFPLNYGEKSPYLYTCVPSNAPEPKTTIWTGLNS